MSSRSPLDLDLSTIRPLVADLQRRLREEENLDDLAAWQKVFRKSVSLFDRSVVAGYLLSQWLGSAAGSRPLPRRKMASTTIFISIGKNRRVFPRDLVQLLAAEGEVPKTDIGEIKILDNYSFVEVEEKAAPALITKLDGATFRGRRLTVNFAKKRPVNAPSSAESTPEEAH